MSDSQEKTIESLRESHNDLSEELAQAESAEERAFIRGKRAGLLQAIATINHFDSSDTPSVTIPTATTRGSIGSPPGEQIQPVSTLRPDSRGDTDE